MWRGYGANGNGAAIVIDMAKINVTETSPLIIAKVSYDTSDARRDWLRAKLQRCRQESGWKLGRHRLREFEDIGLGGEVNWLRDGLFSDGFPSVDFAHADLAGGKQGPEQHPGGFC